MITYKYFEIQNGFIEIRIYKNGVLINEHLCPGEDLNNRIEHFNKIFGGMALI